MPSSIDQSSPATTSNLQYAVWQLVICWARHAGGQAATTHARYPLEQQTQQQLDGTPAPTSADSSCPVAMSVKKLAALASMMAAAAAAVVGV